MWRWVSGPSTTATWVPAFNTFVLPVKGSGEEPVPIAGRFVENAAAVGALRQCDVAGEVGPEVAGIFFTRSISSSSSWHQGPTSPMGGR